MGGVILKAALLFSFFFKYKLQAQGPGWAWVVYIIPRHFGTVRSVDSRYYWYLPSSLLNF